MAGAAKILVIGTGKYEGSEVAQKLFPNQTFEAGSGKPQTRAVDANGAHLEITVLPLLVGNKAEHSIVNEAIEAIKEKPFHGILTVLR